MLAAESILKVFDRQAVFSNLSFQCTRGLYCIEGKNGAGKSTLLKTLAGGMRPNAGRVLVDGLDIYAHGADARRRVGYMPEPPQLYEFLTVRELLEFVALVKDVGQDVYMELTHQLHLTDSLNHKIEVLSNGMKRKVTLICCLMNNPSNLILDEPTNAFDKEAIRFLQGVLDQYQVNGGVVLFSTHDQEFATKFANRRFLLEDGKLKEQRTGNEE